MTDNQIALVLDYQKKKRDLVLKYTGVDLIPSSVAFTVEGLKDINPIRLEDFASSSYLESSNCIHCLIYKPTHNESNCKHCLYDQVGENCKEDSSIFSLALRKWEWIDCGKRVELVELGEKFLDGWSKI